MSKFLLGQKLYYVGNDPMELAFVKYGDEVILVTMPENKQALNLIVRTLSGNKIWVSKSNLSESKPAQPKSKLDDSVDNFVKAPLKEKSGADKGGKRYEVLDLSSEDTPLYAVALTLNDGELDILCECKSSDKAKKIAAAFGAMHDKYVESWKTNPISLLKLKEGREKYIVNVMEFMSKPDFPELECGNLISMTGFEVVTSE